jgi:hypothetical protein
MTQALLFENKVNPSRRTTLPEPWRRLDSGRGKIGSCYWHSAGYTIKHCGHPTALWPYQLLNEDGETLLAQNLRAFRTLDDAAAEVDRVLAGGAPRFWSSN